jgi:hypothetical protein
MIEVLARQFLQVKSPSKTLHSTLCVFHPPHCHGQSFFAKNQAASLGLSCWNAGAMPAGTDRSF